MKYDLDRQPQGRFLVTVAEVIVIEPPAAMSETLPDRVALTGELTVDNLEARVLLRGELAAEAELACDRCLENYRARFEAPVEITILRDRSSEDEADVCVIHQRSGEVDLGAPLREAALLALPLKRLCGEQCRGLCSGCGANLNLEPCRCPARRHDPRWDQLPEA